MRANTENIRFRNSLWWLIYIVNSVDKTKSSDFFVVINYYIVTKKLSNSQIVEDLFFLGNNSKYSRSFQ